MYLVIEDQYERFSIFHTQDLCLRHKLGMCLAKASHCNEEQYERFSIFHIQDLCLVKARQQE